MKKKSCKWYKRFVVVMMNIIIVVLIEQNAGTNHRGWFTISL